MLDHKIIVAELDYQPTFTAPQNHGAQRDYFSFGRAMKNEEAAEILRARVEQALASTLRQAGYLEVDAWMRSHTPEPAWSEMVHVIQECAKQDYSTSRKRRPEWYAELAREREAALRARTAARDQLD